MVAETIITDLEAHPLSRVFPDMPRARFQELVADIKEHGVIEPVVLFEGEILDGRHRYRAAVQAGVECPTVKFEDLGFGGSPAEYVLSVNRHRRHLTKGQLGMIAVEIEQIEASLARERQAEAGRRSAPGKCAPARRSLSPGRAADRAGAKVGVSGRTVAKAKQLAQADPEEAEKVRQGEKGVDQALKDAAAKKAPPRPSKPDDDGTFGADMHGTPIRTREAADALAAAADFRRLYQQLEAVQREANKLSKGGGAWIKFTRSTFEHGLKQSKKTLDLEQPFAACVFWPNCEHNNCEACGGRGWMTKRDFQTHQARTRRTAAT